MTTLEDVGHSSWRGRAPLVIAAGIPLLVVAVLPWRALALDALPGFSGLWLAAVVLSELLVAHLLLGQYRAGGSTRLLATAVAYLSAAASALIMVLTAPGLLSAASRPADLNTVAWLWVWWHVVPPVLFALALAPWPQRADRPLDRPLDRSVATGLSVGAVALVSGLFALGCATWPGVLPTIVHPHSGQLAAWTTVLVLLVGGTSLAFTVTGAWRLGASHRLESWAVVASAASLGDCALTLLNDDSWSLGFYAARLLALVASVLVLGAVLHGIARLQTAASDAAERLEARNADLLEAQRLRDHLTAVVSHDLRTPLAGLQGYLEMLRDDDLDPALARRMIERSWLLTRRLTLLTEDLLAAATLENGDLVVTPERVHLATALGECASCFPDLDLELDCPPALTAYADPLRLQQVLANLVRNAQKHGAEPVLIAASPGPGGAVTVQVSDAGPGVPATFVPRLFDRYSQGVASATGGSGLGLSVVRDLVAAHAGTVHYDPGGNAFVFTLPPAPVSAPVASASVPAGFPGPRAAARG